MRHTAGFRCINLSAQADTGTALCDKTLTTASLPFQIHNSHCPHPMIGNVSVLQSCN